MLLLRAHFQVAIEGIWCQCMEALVPFIIYFKKTRRDYRSSVGVFECVRGTSAAITVRDWCSLMTPLPPAPPQTPYTFFKRRLSVENCECTSNYNVCPTERQLKSVKIKLKAFWNQHFGFGSQVAPQLFHDGYSGVHTSILSALCNVPQLALLQSLLRLQPWKAATETGIKLHNFRDRHRGLHHCQLKKAMKTK